ncbi:hypothetical protein ADL27_53280 [Streptomyces sp. NRRL F-6602]|nr:hypothetical protein ADL27_53280 [Streptomyces sp. NRRL F-6602]
MTTAPARPTLLGPDGQAITPTSAPAADWKPVQREDNAVVWERPRPVVVPEVDPLEEARAEADQVLEDARTEAERVRAEAQSLRTRTLAAATSEANAIREAAAAETAKKEERGRRVDWWAGRAVITGAVGLTAFGEYSLARLAHFPAQVAWLLPFVIDVYVIQAFRRHRDIAPAISLTIAANVIYHLAAAGMFGVTKTDGGEYRATWWLIALVSSIASVILWRMHVMTAPPKPKKVRRSTGTEAHREAVPETPVKAVQTASDGPVPVDVRTAPGTGCEQQETAPVPVTGTAPVPPVSTAPVPVPEATPAPTLHAVPEPGRKPAQRQRSTGPRYRKKTPRGTATKTGTGTGSFEEHVSLAREWLAADPGLSGTAIGKRLGTGDSYGRRVKRSALEGA